MKTYSEKLRDPRWIEFRQTVFRLKGTSCETCGESKLTNKSNHIHHKCYRKGMEPWEYDIEDVAVICSECHEEIHEAEESWRNLIRQSPSWLAFHYKRLSDFMGKIDPHDASDVLAKAKAHAESLSYRKASHYGW